MRIANWSQADVRPVTPVRWLAVPCLVGALAFSCNDATRLDAAQAREADRRLDELQRVSPLLPTAEPAGPLAGDVTDLQQSPAEAGAAELPLADAGVVEPGSSDTSEPPPVEVADAGAPAEEPVITPEVSAADAGPGEPPRDIVADAALPIHALVDGQLLTEAQLWERLARAPVTCFGELHDRAADHFAETRALSELVKRANGAPLALGMEMFQRPFQAPLTAFVRGELDEAGLITATEYVDRWGWDFAFYRPLLEAARRAGLPVLALNAPRELTRKIGRTGLASLDESERAQLPELNLDDAEHRDFIFGLFGVLDHEEQLELEDVYVAQTVWDETMAESSATWLSATGADARLLILAGSAHCHESAIPRRLARRTGLEVTSLAVALASELGTPEFSAAGYDVLVLLEDIPLPSDLGSPTAPAPGAE